MMDVTVIVATYGSKEWEKLGDEALESIKNIGSNTHRIHLKSGSLAQARNKALKEVTTKYVCFLDADDTLTKDYFNFKPKADITVTKIRYRGFGAGKIPKVWQHEHNESKKHEGNCKGECLLDGNWVHIGAIMKTAVAKRVKFREYPVYEDYAYFLEQYLNGATFGISDSLYQASIRQSPGHRNQSLPLTKRNKIHFQIYKDITDNEWS